jgi:hypothetical protein
MVVHSYSQCNCCFLWLETLYLETLKLWSTDWTLTHAASEKLEINSPVNTNVYTRERRWEREKERKKASHPESWLFLEIITEYGSLLGPPELWSLNRKKVPCIEGPYHWSRVCFKQTERFWIQLVLCSYCT